MHEATTSDWLSTVGWGRWRRQPIAGDASARRYERLYDPGSDQTAVLMIAPPKTCGSQDRFVAIADLLRGHGLAAPRVLVSDLETGHLILEDLGLNDFASWIAAHPIDEHRLYSSAVEVLVRLRSIPAPEGLGVFDPDTGTAMIGLFFDYFATQTADEARLEIERELAASLEAISDQRQVLSLRDFHAENLIWRAERTGLSRVGLLDFQDAFAAPATYDLVSLIQDARRDVDPETAEQCIKAFARKSGEDPDRVRYSCAVLGLQRNLRILGVFERLTVRDNKPAYRTLIPRVRGHVIATLDHPGLSRLQPLVLRAVTEGAT